MTLALVSWGFQILLKYLRFSRVTGTVRIPTVGEAADDQATSISLDVSATITSKTLPVTPVSVAWTDIKYSVPIKGQKEEKVLLDGISGAVRPGQLIALMGATGAGKTTLLDVLANRKTTGTRSGKILSNGVEMSPDVYRCVCLCACVPGGTPLLLRLIPLVRYQQHHRIRATTRRACGHSYRA
jgi:ABC-type multidrug transport system fused ATPase/permease subunit